MPEKIAVVCAADDGYAMPLGVMVRSVLESLNPSTKLSLFVLDGGLSAQSQERLCRSWPADRLEIEWIKPDTAALAGLPVSDQVTIATYFRVLIPRLLPERLDKVIYLDSDAVVVADLCRLWREPFYGSHCLAVQDVAAPYMDAERVLPNFARCAAYLAGARPVPNYHQLGISPFAKYFNAGVLVIDLARWRRDAVADRLLECLHKHRDHVLWWDQYALNVVLWEKWRALDLRWNQLPHIHACPSWRESFLGEDAFRRVVAEPFIVHFATVEKPWHYDNVHPQRDLFYRYLDMTAWSGWRPQRPRFLSLRWRQRQIQSWRRAYQRGRRFLRNRLLKKSA
jgi:lipopolysaccharide biosynthesis glycosyltransferase